MIHEEDSWSSPYVVSARILRPSFFSQPGLQEDTHKNMQNESEAGNATRKSQKQRLTKKKIKTSRRVTGATSINPPKIADKVVASSV